MKEIKDKTLSKNEKQDFEEKNSKMLLPIPKVTKINNKNFCISLKHEIQLYYKL